MMKVRREVIDAMIDHALRDAPLEACGYGGMIDGVVVEAYALRNVDQSAQHFGFDPAEQFAVVRTMRGKGQRPALVYHSHPQTPARPSAEDIRLAVDPSITCVIVSLAGQIPDVKAFTIRNKVTTVEPIEVEA